MRLYIFFLILISVPLLFFHLGTRPLLSSGEPRASEIALEMLQRANWLVPYLNEEIVLTKPPLFHWFIIFSYKFFGVSEFSSRLPSAVAGVFTIVFVYLFGKRLWDKRVGLYSGLILLVSPMFFWHARCARIDSLLLLLITISIYCFWRGYEDKDKGRKWFTGWFFFMGLAVLAKGPVGVLIPLSIGVLFLISVGKLHLLKKLDWLFGLTVFSVIVFPWFITVYLLVPHYKSEIFFWKQILMWFSGYGEWYKGYVYIPQLFLGFFPWSLILPLLFIYGWRNRKDERIIFLWIWCFIVFFFFCFFGKKVSRYILPLLPSISLLTGSIIIQRKAVNRVFSSAFVVVWFFIVLLVNLYPKFLEPELAFIVGRYVNRFLFTIVGIGVAILCLKWANFPISVTISYFTILMFILHYIPIESDYYSPKPFCRMLKEVVPNDATICSYKSWDNSIRYYYGRHVDIISTEDELVKFLNSQHRVYCFMWDYVYRGLPDSIKEKLFVIKTGYKVMERRVVLVSNKG